MGIVDHLEDVLADTPVEHTLLAPKQQHRCAAENGKRRRGKRCKRNGTVKIHDRWYCATHAPRY